MGADLEARDLDLLAVASLLALAHPRMQNVLVASQTREREREREREYSQQFIIDGGGWGWWWLWPTAHDRMQRRSGNTSHFMHGSSMPAAGGSGLLTSDLGR